MSDKKFVTENPFGRSDNRQPVQRKPKPVELPKEEEKEVSKPVEEKTKDSTDLLAGLSEPKSEAKNYSIYLDTDVVTQLDKLAKRNKTSRSKVLNTILRNYFSK